ncbi:MAG: phospholipase A [Zhongshania sp.]|uniref:phospholipase A n=1 Tax=Zhongshania sp. TaxID=1971902 RepID=UPI00262FCE7F|nr:phospholipase A [Zhongshania sp.]MDF1691148.1 phospholipase A [Zhongshania sp.]
MKHLAIIAALVLIPIASLAQTQQELECLQLAAQSAAESTTVGELRSLCNAPLWPTDRDPQSQTANDPAQNLTPHRVSGIVRERQALERFTVDNPFVLTPHRSNYVMPISYRDSISHYSNVTSLDNSQADNIELEFQLSIKVMVWENIFKDNGFLSIGYTNRSYWQAYNDIASAPFRETNHEPELMFTITHDWEWLGFHYVGDQLIFNHQSNGRSEPQSRSWNRLMLNMIFERDRFAMSFKPWYRLKESAKDDDNPDIEKYLGHFEWMGIYQWHNRTLSLMLRNNLRSDSKGAVEIGWSFPINSRVKAYVKYFNGYGESLIEYNNAIESIGIGVLISDWL